MPSVIRHSAFVILFFICGCLSAQTSGQFELRKRTATGFTSYGVTAENGKALGFTAGVPAMLEVGGTATWGGITGTLSSQTDLNTALGLKLASATAASTYAPITGPVFIGQIGSDGDIVGQSAGAVRYSDGQIRFYGGANSSPYHGGVGGQLSLYGADADGQHGGNGGNINMYGSPGQNAGSISTIAGGSLTMGSASLAGGAIAGTILTTAGDGSGLTALNASALSGLVPTASLGSGTANSTTYLRGDNTWATVTGGVTSITGTANEITVTGTTTPTLSLPAAITFTGKTITGGTLSGVALGTPASGTLTNCTSLPAAGVTGTALTLSGGTLTGALTLPNAIFSGLSLTSAQATNTIDVSTTWNTSGNPSLIYGRITNTASGSTSKFFDFGTVAGGSLLFASKAGTLSAISGVRVGDDYQVFSVWTSGEPNYSFRSCMFGGSIGGILPSDRTFAWSSVGWGSSGDCYSNRDLILGRAAAASMQMGLTAASGTPTAQTLKGPNGAAGQTNQPGGNLTLSSGLSTGSGAASVIIATSGNTAGSTTLNSVVTRLTANASGIAIGANGTAAATIKHGTAALVAGTVTVSDSDVAAASRILINRQTDGGTLGDSYSITRSAGVSFTITAKSANATATGDTSTVTWLMINP